MDMWTKTFLLTCCCAGCYSLSIRCGVPIDGETETATKPCGTLSNYEDGDLNSGPPALVDDGDDASAFPSRGIYILFVVGGILLVPLVVIIRLCWTRKIAKNNQRRIVAAREMIERHLREQSMHHIFTITNGAIVPCGGPPTYEETIADPDMGKPPSYDDLPPRYNEAMKTNQINQTGDQQPSSSRQP